MGNFICKTKRDAKENNIGSRSKRTGGDRPSRRRSLMEEELLHRQALNLALQQHQLSQRFEGSMSRRIGSTSSRRQKNNLSDSFSTSTKQVGAFWFDSLCAAKDITEKVLELSYNDDPKKYGEKWEMGDFLSGKS